MRWKKFSNHKEKRPKDSEVKKEKERCEKISLSIIRDGLTWMGILCNLRHNGGETQHREGNVQK